MQDGVTGEVESAPAGIPLFDEVGNGGGQKLNGEVDDQILQSLFKL